MRLQATKMSGAPSASFNIRIIMRPISIANFEASRVLDCQLLQSSHGKGGRHIPVKDSAASAIGS